MPIKMQDLPKRDRCIRLQNSYYTSAFYFLLLLSTRKENFYFVKDNGLWYVQSVMFWEICRYFSSAIIFNERWVDSFFLNNSKVFPTYWNAHFIVFWKPENRLPLEQHTVRMFVVGWRIAIRRWIEIVLNG